MHSDLGQLIAQANRTSVERRFELAALPEGWSAVLMLAAGLLVCWAVVWMYRKEQRRGASMTVRTMLAAIRCAVLLLLAAIWLQPVLATYLHRWIDSYCIVLIDDSSSMDLDDQYRLKDEADRVKSVLADGQSLPIRRADIAERLLRRDDRRLLRELTERNRVKVYGFSDTPELVATLRAARESGADAPGTTAEGDTATDVAAARTSFAAQGPATNVARAVKRSLESLGGAPLAGVVLFSDGGFNQGDSVDTLCRYVQERGIAMHVVGIGDASPPQNVRVTEVIAPSNAFKEDPFAVTAHIITQGMITGSIVVELYERTDDQTANQAPVDTRTVTITADGPLEPIVFQRQRKSVGRVAYRVIVPVGPFESVSDDNVKQAVVNVIDDKMRVLIVAGSPSWEYRYVSRLLTRDATFDVSCWLQSADLDAVRDGNTVIQQLPATPEELFAYDAVVLIDPDSSEFGPGWAQSLETLVSEHGGGFLYVASRKYTPGFMRDPAVSRIVSILPVKLDPEADIILNQLGHYQTRSWPIDIPQSALNHTILALPDKSADPRTVWSHVSGVYWHYPVLREKPVATVLMRDSDPKMRNSYGGHVLAATQFVGAGRSAFLAFDSTWRWRGESEDIFDSFWVQMLRYLVEGKLLGARKRATLMTEQSTAQLGSTINVSARLYNARFEPLNVDQIVATYAIESQKTNMTLKRSVDRPGWYEGRFTPSQTGDYELSLALPPEAGAEPVTTTHHVQVVRPNIEILHPQMNRSALKLLAERSPGGGYYEVDQVDELANAIPDRHESTTVRSRPTPLWDNQWMLIALIALLTIEWGVRKWVRLL